MSEDADLAVLAEWREWVNKMLEKIDTQTAETRGRVSELEVKDRIRRDREEQKANRDAAAEAAKYRIEQMQREEQAEALEHHRVRVTWRVMLSAAGLGALPGVLLESARLIVTGHV